MSKPFVIGSKVVIDGWFLIELERSGIYPGVGIVQEVELRLRPDYYVYKVVFPDMNRTVTLGQDALRNADSRWSRFLAWLKGIR